MSRKFANHYWPGQNPLGKRIRIGTHEMQTPWLTVVGEVADVKLRSPDEDTQEEFYQVEGQAEASIGSLATPSDLNGNGGYIVLRSALPPEHMENALRAIVHALDPQLALIQVQTMEHAISDTEAPRRFNTILITSFAFCGCAACRTRHLQRDCVFRRLTHAGACDPNGGGLAALGHYAADPDFGVEARDCRLIGLAGAAAASGLLRSLLFGVSPFDLPVLTFAAVAIFLLALAASAIPARRAATLDPMQALRAE